MSALVAFIVRWQFDPEVGALVRVDRRHDVPADAAFGHVVERLKRPSKLIRMHKRGRHRGDKAEVFGLGRQSGDQDDRIEQREVVAVAN